MAKYRLLILVAVGLLVVSVPYTTGPLIDRATFAAKDLCYYLYFISRYWLVDSTNPYDPLFQNVVISEMMGKNMINAMSLVWTPSAFFVLAPFAFLQSLWLPLGVLCFVGLAYIVFCKTISEILSNLDTHPERKEIKQQIWIFVAAAICSQCFFIGLRLGQPILLCLSGLIILTSIVKDSTRNAYGIWVGIFLVLSTKPFYLLCPVVLLIRERRILLLFACSAAVSIFWIVFTLKTGIEWIPSYIEALSAFSSNTSSPIYGCLIGARTFTVTLATALAPIAGDAMSFRLASLMLVGGSVLLLSIAATRAMSTRCNTAERNILITLAVAIPTLFLQFLSPYEELLLLVPILAITASASLARRKLLTSFVVFTFIFVMVRPEVPGDIYRAVIFTSKILLLSFLIYAEASRSSTQQKGLS